MPKITKLCLHLLKLCRKKTVVFFRTRCTIKPLCHYNAFYSKSCRCIHRHVSGFVSVMYENVRLSKAAVKQE